MYKDKNSGAFQGKLVAGPMWDFNLSYGNADYCNAQLTTGWQYNFDEVCNFTSAIPFWWERLLDAPSYRNGLKCRWNELRQGVLHTDSINYWIDSMSLMLTESRARNYQKWPIIGVYVNWNGFVGNTYEEDLGFFKDYIATRANWIDANLPGICDLSVNSISEENDIDVYPNPSKENLFIGSSNLLKSIEIYDQTGKVISTIDMTNEPLKSIQISLLPYNAGVYLLKITQIDDRVSQRRFVKQ